MFTQHRHAETRRLPVMLVDTSAISSHQCVVCCCACVKQGALAKTPWAGKGGKRKAPDGGGGGGGGETREVDAVTGEDQVRRAAERSPAAHSRARSGAFTMFQRLHLSVRCALVQHTNACAARQSRL
jgi:hypothetical protein